MALSGSSPAPSSFPGSGELVLGLHNASSPGSPGGNEISEFPYFTFLYGDMHAHMMGLPLAILSLTWALGLLKGAGLGRSRTATVLLWLCGGLAVGATRVTNTWDFPTYLALGGVAVVAAEWRGGRSGTGAGGLRAAARLAVFVALAFLLFPAI